MSLIDLQRQIIQDAIHKDKPDIWRYVVIDEQSERLITNVLDVEKLLNQKVSGVDRIENKRVARPDFEVVYILSPLPHIIDCLISDFQRPRPRYAGAWLLWTSQLSDNLKQTLARALGDSNKGRWILGEQQLGIDYFPRESHLFTFRDPNSFYPLYHPGCDDLAQREFKDLAKKILGICITLGEFPIIRFFRSPHLTHRARLLPQMIANSVQRELEMYQDDLEKRGIAWPVEEKGRPRAVLFIVDRSLDPVAPFLHEFTYQSMAHDLLPITVGEKVTFLAEVPGPSGGKEEKEFPILEEDKLWRQYRHKHMKDVIELLRDDFAKFRKDNPHFSNVEGANSVFAIRDMLASLPTFAAEKDAFELHFSMTQDCMDIFQGNKLPDTSDLEQNMATGLDSNGDKARGITDQFIRLLAAPETSKNNIRLRLILIYLLYRDGLVGTDVEKLFRHAEIPNTMRNALYNLDLIGVRTVKQAKDNYRPSYRKMKPFGAPIPEGYELSRFVPMVKVMLDDYTKGTLDQETYPTTDSVNSPNQQASAIETVTQANLRSAAGRAKWTSSTRSAAVDVRQRMIVFMAGGATYSEARACYEISASANRDVYLGSSHMISPESWMDQLITARMDRRELRLEQDIPAQQRPRAPAHLFEPDPVPNQPKPAQSGMQPGRLSASTAVPPRPTASPQPGANGGSSRPISLNSSAGDKDKKKKKFFGLG